MRNLRSVNTYLVVTNEVSNEKATDWKVATVGTRCSQQSFYNLISYVRFVGRQEFVSEIYSVDVVVYRLSNLTQYLQNTYNIIPITVPFPLSEYLTLYYLINFIVVAVHR